MKFRVKAWSKKARVGELQVGSCPHAIETPALLLSTRKGLPLFISPDLLPSLPSPDSFLLQCSPLHFLEGLSLATISNIGGLHDLLGLREYVLAATPRDSVVCLPECKSTNKFGASFETPSGRHLIKPVEYMKMISSMKPNLWTTLADEVPAWVSEKRNKTSVDRTVKWLDDCLSENVTGGTVFGSIVGGRSAEERRRCAEEVATRNVSDMGQELDQQFAYDLEILNGIICYWIGGFGLGESMEERPALLDAVVDNLPEEKPRHISGLALPEEVLQGISAGADLFDSMYIYHLTLGGFALTFPVDGTEHHSSNSQLSNHASDFTKINLKATVYRKDESPIIHNCNCYTCQNHTKAYINHLLNVHEMLAQTLLEIHNTHHYLALFRDIRKAIKEDRFEEYKQKFIEGRRDYSFTAPLR